MPLKGNGPKPNHVLCHSAACIHSDGDRVGDSEPEAEGDDVDSEAGQEHGGEMHSCIKRSWGGSCHLEMPKLWVWQQRWGEAYQRQTQTQMGLGLWHKAIAWKAATPSRLGGQTPYPNRRPPGLLFDISVRIPGEGLLFG